MVIETDVKFCIRTLHDFFVLSSSWERELKDALRFLHGMNFLDVGAHLGRYTLRAAKKIGSNGKVIAVEPNKDNYAFLVRNIRLNRFDNCLALNIAGYSSNSEVELFFGEDSARHSIKEDFGKGFYRVKARILDDVLKENGIRSVDLIKVDVEGAELEVLKGLNNTLKKQNPKLIIEVLKRDKRKIADYLTSLGYEGKILRTYQEFEGGLLHCFFQKHK